jgi:hypothetical protein
VSLFSNNEKITEQEAVDAYVPMVLNEAISTWELFKKAIKELNYGEKITFEDDEDASLELGIAIISTTLICLKEHSPLFSKDQANRIETLAKEQFIKRFKLPIPIVKQILDSIDAYQDEFNEAMKAGNNPFGHITGVLICRCLGEQSLKLRVNGTTALSPLLLTIVGDIFMYTGIN